MFSSFGARTFAIMLAVMACANASHAGNGPVRQHDLWGRFEPGAWKTVRVATETYDGREVLTSLVETKTTLTTLDSDGVTLLVEAAVELRGRRFDPQPQAIRQGFHGEPLGGVLHIAELEDRRLSIQGREIVCRVEQVECVDSASRTLTKIFYSPEVPPFVLRREAVKSDLEGKTIYIETTSSVVALDVPYLILGEVHNAAQVETTQKHPKGSATRTAIVSLDVPGGVVCHTAQEFDSGGRLIRHSTLELVDYGFSIEDDRMGLFHRKRPGCVWKPLFPHLK